ncbi:predicted protein [Naegleria gruberi]|uniref:Predicted protein n=1 Tax=Naegleria gruberi TaxID=5762 RepID=D2W132_NAEGR|nr:uncharacterized protein NAEGRDRAFT_75071 [Naegleria gruberi]EFC37241.1 predicted protein [Naegleria gruberi]|eukprot:XP_002669985.1 predicted protein [Naegleria gruberi strain NEG-M]
MTANHSILALFMKVFITYMWFEPIFCEIVLGLLLFFFPTNEFVINSFVHTPLFNAMKESLPIHDSLAFLMRFISMLLTIFGGLHLLLMVACNYHQRDVESQNKWSKNVLFNAMVAILLVGDCFHVLCVLTLDGSLKSQIVYQLPLTIYCIIVRGMFIIMNQFKMLNDF